VWAERIYPRPPRRSDFQVFLVSFCGYMLKRNGKINLETRKTISAIIVALLVPSFLFTK
jgi:predicted permease